MRALFIMNGAWGTSATPNISGGDVRWIEVAKVWQQRGVLVSVLTTETGRALCGKLGLKAKFLVASTRQSPSAVSYLVSLSRVADSLPKLRGAIDVVYSSTEHLYDVLPGYFLKSRFAARVWLSVLHWVAPPLRRNTNPIRSGLFFLSQRLSFRLLRRAADAVLCVSPQTRKDASNLGMSEARLHLVGCGVPFEEIGRAPTLGGYDGIFMKRLTPSKGIFDCISAWKSVVSRMPKARLAIVGTGDDKTVAAVRQKISEMGLIGHVDMLGPKYDPSEKFGLLKGAKVMLQPSYEENWAIIIGEAMACRTPVVCYELPEIAGVWQDRALWVPRGDIHGIADAVVSLLNDDILRAQVAARAYDLVRDMDWETIADYELRVARNLVSSDRRAQ